MVKSAAMTRLIAACLVALLAPAVFAQAPRATETIEVTATRIAENVTIVPASITVIDGDELRARNANDLASALALTAGVSAVGGSDAGPAGGVPEMWGLREVDAFLLVVDDVPWGGAFNPDMPTLDLTGVDRIEILRGAAPVMYGATSFVGVIHVIHKNAGATGDARISAGSYGSGSAAAMVPITQSPALRQSIVASAERRGFSGDDTSFDRGHVLYRLGTDLAGGVLRLDADATILRQKPGSPHPRTGPELTTLVPLDANFNPAGARLDENRLNVAGGFTRGSWVTTLALTQSKFDINRGFLTDVSAGPSNASGFAQSRRVTDLYFDSHLVRQFTPALRGVFGVDNLFGNGRAASDLFTYSVPLTGGGPSAVDVDESTHLEDRRNFAGLYGSAEWTPLARLRIDAGLRLNHLRERRTGESADGTDSSERTTTRASGVVGANWTLVSRGAETLVVFGDYRNTIKPAAIDFGPDPEGDILAPETAQSVEAGLKGIAAGGRLRWEASTFVMNFENLVVSTIRDGQPALENAGRERFTGAEGEVSWSVTAALQAQATYSYHDARFRDYVTEFDGVPAQLSGKRLEMSPLHMAGVGLVYSPPRGFVGSAVLNYVGERYMNKRNTAPAGAYTTLSAGLGYRFGSGELRVDGRNLANERPPVAESELGDAQYYLLQARSIDVTYRTRF